MDSLNIKILNNCWYIYLTWDLSGADFRVKETSVVSEKLKKYSAGTLTCLGSDLPVSSLTVEQSPFLVPFLSNLKNHFIYAPLGVQLVFLKCQNAHLPHSLSESPFNIFQSLSHSPNTRLHIEPKDCVSSQPLYIPTPMPLHYISAQIILPWKQGVSYSTVFKNRVLVWNADSRAPHPEIQIQHVCTRARSLSTYSTTMTVSEKDVWYLLQIRLQSWILCGVVVLRTGMEVILFSEFTWYLLLMLQLWRYCVNN